MFIFEDLNIYKKQYFRSYDYLNKAWDIIETKLIYYIGMLNNINVSIIIDSSGIHFTVTSNFKTYTSTEEMFKIMHCLNLCDYFYIEIELNIITSHKEFSYIIEKNTFYHGNKKNDEGVVEFYANFCFNLTDYLKFKEIVFSNIVKEIQFAINRNIFHLDYENNIKSKIDAELECLITSLFFKKDLEKSFKYLEKNKIISKERKNILLSLKELIDEK
tara:strand:- start:609 stop:1259 length:651 start_codon:yes stop_codon:yes gene_type:complete